MVGIDLPKRMRETPHPPWLLEGMGDSSANYAWQKQETKKGSHFVAGTAYGGWGFHKWRIAGFDYQYTAAEAASMVSDGSVTNNPVFNRGYAPMLSNDATEDGISMEYDHLHQEHLEYLEYLAFHQHHSYR